MEAPIYSYLIRYRDSSAHRLHMPGHKGQGSELPFNLDITEIDGADSLFAPDGIIAESERNAGELFSAQTLYSTEGSTLSIKAMLYLVALYARKKGERPLVLAARNAHKSFLSAAALIDFDIEWIYPKRGESYLSLDVSCDDIEKRFSEMERLPTALYLTSPDYLGHTLDIEAIAHVCKTNGVLLLVDNAHGAYLKFLEGSRHPIDLGADMCADSAHKTLHAITGSAYLHISKDAPEALAHGAKEAMSLFASTSPSYLMLASLDLLNQRLAGEFRNNLSRFIKELEELKSELLALGYKIISSEPLKIALDTKAYGYFAYEVAEHLKAKGIFPEFYDSDYLVLMFSYENGEAALSDLLNALRSLDKRDEIKSCAPDFFMPVSKMSVREAVMSGFEKISTSSAFGRILALPGVSCPPAVPILVPGELIDEKAIARFEYYGIDECYVVKEA